MRVSFVGWSTFFNHEPMKIIPRRETCVVKRCTSLCGVAILPCLLLLVTKCVARHGCASEASRNALTLERNLREGKTHSPGQVYSSRALSA